MGRTMKKKGREHYGRELYHGVRTDSGQRDHCVDPHLSVTFYHFLMSLEQTALLGENFSIHIDKLVWINS